MPGPPPKTNPVRRNARSGPLQLPAEGRKGPTPEWPLADEPDENEAQAWGELWATPQAVAWERMGWTRTVARYCRAMVEAEKRGASAQLLGQVTTLEDRLGLTPKAMRMLLWEVVADEVAEKRSTGSTRGRVKAV